MIDVEDNERYASGQVPRVGDLVAYNGHGHHSVSVGHPARVVDVNVENMYTDLVWIQDSVYGPTEQNDGCYYAGSFILVDREPLRDDDVVEVTVGKLRELMAAGEFETQIGNYLKVGD